MPKARVLADYYSLGKVNDVVELTKEEIKSFKELGLVDDNRDAVAYALSLTGAPDTPAQPSAEAQ